MTEPTPTLDKKDLNSLVLPLGSTGLVLRRHKRPHETGYQSERAFVETSVRETHLQSPTFTATRIDGRGQILSDRKGIGLEVPIAKMRKKGRGYHSARLTPSVPTSMLVSEVKLLLDVWLSADAVWVVADPNSDALAGCLVVQSAPTTEGHVPVLWHVYVKPMLRNMNIASSALASFGIVKDVTCLYAVSPPHETHNGYADPLVPGRDSWRLEWLHSSNFVFMGPYLMMGSLGVLEPVAIKLAQELHEQYVNTTNEIDAVTQEGITR